MILDSFPKILWINLARSKDRSEYMNTLLNKFKLNHTRIDAVNGLDAKLINNICDINLNISFFENACTCSHLHAIKYFVENMIDECVIIFEDDVSFDFLPLIPYNWSKLTTNFPANYDVIQLAVTRNVNDHVTNSLIKINPEMKYYCSAAYLITRSGAKKLLEKYYSNGKIILSSQKYATADAMILNLDNVYSIPIFTYLLNSSLIHQNHYYLHTRSKMQQYLMWKNIGVFDFNKYFDGFPK